MNVFWCINRKIKDRPSGAAKGLNVWNVYSRVLKDYRVADRDLIKDFSK